METLVDGIIEHGYDTKSFQRTSLIVMKNYAVVLICCTILSKLQSQKFLTGRKVQTTQVFKDLAVETLMTTIDHLEYILGNATFKWHLMFSPTYSALTIAFSSMPVVLPISDSS